MVVVLLLLLDLVWVVIFVVCLLFCCSVVLLFGQQQPKKEQPPKKQQNQLFYSVFPRWVWCCCRFGVCLIFCSLEFEVPWLLFCCGCLLLFWWLLFVGLLFCCFVGATTTKQKHNPKNNKTPCFVVFFFAVVITGLWPQKSQQPNAIKRNIFNFFLVPKRLLSAERSVWFHAAHLFLCFCCFLFCSNLWSHFESRFPDPCSNWFSRVWNFDKNCAEMFNIWDGYLHENTINSWAWNKISNAKTWSKIDQFESRFGVHNEAGSGSTDMPHFGARMLVL